MSCWVYGDGKLLGVGFVKEDEEVLAEKHRYAVR
jgi:hypothetical protein